MNLELNRSTDVGRPPGGLLFSASGLAPPRHIRAGSGELIRGEADLDGAKPGRPSAPG